MWLLIGTVSKVSDVAQGPSVVKDVQFDLNLKSYNLKIKKEHFSSPPEPTGQFQPNWHKASLDEGE